MYPTLPQAYLSSPDAEPSSWAVLAANNETFGIYHAGGLGTFRDLPLILMLLSTRPPKCSLNPPTSQLDLRLEHLHSFPGSTWLPRRHHGPCSIAPTKKKNPKSFLQLSIKNKSGLSKESLYSKGLSQGERKGTMPRGERSDCEVCKPPKAEARGFSFHKAE